MKGWPDLALQLTVSRWNHGGTPTVGYLCQVQLQLQMARGAQFMALAQIQMIAVRHSVLCIDCMPFLFVVKFVFGCVTTLQFIRIICDRIVAVQSTVCVVAHVLLVAPPCECVLLLAPYLCGVRQPLFIY